MLESEFFLDEFAITGCRIEALRQFFIKISGEDGDPYLEAVGKTAYQVFNFFFQQEFDSVHTESIT